MTSPKSTTKSALLGALENVPTVIAHQSEIMASLQDAATTICAEMLGENVQFTPPAMSQLARKAVLDRLAPGALVQVLRAGPAPPIGLVSLAPNLVRAIASTLSGAKRRGAADAPPSRVECSLAELFAQRLLGAFAEKLTPDAGVSRVAPQQNRGANLARHHLQSRLSDGQYAAFSIGFSFNSEDEDHTLTLYFHIDFCNKLAENAAPDNPTKLGAEAQHWLRHMHQVALVAPIATRCVIDRFSLPTGIVSRLQRGDILALPGLGITDITLELPHRSGALAFGRGKLGAMRRNKALQLHALAQDSPPISAPQPAPTKEITQD